MRAPLRDDAGLAGTILIIAIAWALAAVLMLTGTLISAQQIDDRVRYITSQVSPIDKDLDNVKLAVKINDNAIKILDAAAPLTGQLDDVIESAESIDRTVPQILRTAGSINETAGSINTTVKSIGSTVGDIHSNVSAIRDEVHHIRGEGMVGIVGINHRVITVLGLVGGIRSDLGKVLALVGLGPRGNTINGHANSIDCKLGPGGACK